MNAPQIVTTPAAIRAEGLTKRYGEVLAVDGLTLEIGTGQFFGLLGPNGSGKTTTIHMLATLIQPNAGSAEVAGFDVGRNAVKAREAIGIVFQESALDRTLTVAENLRFAGLLRFRRRPKCGQGARGDWDRISGIRAGSNAHGRRKPALRGAAPEFAASDDL